MAIRLAKDLTKDENKQRSTALNITFTENQTYDLDELAALHNRNDSLSALVIEVKHEAEIAARVLSTMRETISNEITTSLGTEEVQEGILNIIKQIFEKYKSLTLSSEYDIEYLVSNNLPYEGYKELKDNINEYLQSVYENSHIQYAIVVNGAETVITYKFKSSDELDAAFAEYYSLYAEKYSKELTIVEEGGLAISDANNEKLHAKTADFEKYLLDDSNQVTPKTKPVDNLDPGTYISNKRPVIMWEEGTDDTKTEDISSDVYDDIDVLTAKMAEKDAKIAELTNNIETLTAALNKLSAFMDLDVVRSLSAATYDDRYIPTAKAIVDYIQGCVITADNYDFTSEEKTIIGSFVASYDTEVIYKSNGAILDVEVDNLEIIDRNAPN